MHIKAEICIYVTFYTFTVFKILLIQYIFKLYFVSVFIYVFIYSFLIWAGSVLNRIDTICKL